MPVPDYQSLMLPVLRLTAERERPIRECTTIIAISSASLQRSAMS